MLPAIPFHFFFGSSVFWVNRERTFRALVLQNHSKYIRLFGHSENNLTVITKSGLQNAISPI
jgi:hypothetical protein